MKVASLSFLLACGATNAFAPTTVSTQNSATQLNLFGGGAKKDGDSKGPGMMDQLAMLKKAQEMASKKTKLDQELSAMEFEGVAEDGKVKATFKFVPPKGMMDPQPDYEATGFEFDDAWYEGASPEDLSAAIKAAYDDGINKTNEKVQEKYQALQGDLMEVMGQGGAPPS